MFDVLPRTLQRALYSLLQQLAQVGWTIDQSLLYIINLLDTWRRTLVERGFTTALDHVATNVVGLSRPMLNLVLILACLLMMLAPITIFRWVNVRKAFLLAFLLPIALPWVAANVQQIDAARGDLASSLYNSIFADSAGDFAVDDGGTGQAQQMGELIPYADRDDGREGLRGLDVAAAYLYATKHDVDAGAALPAGFRAVYFPETVESLGEKEDPERWLIVTQAGNGVTRTLYAILPLLVALFEGLTNLALSVALGFTLLTAMLASLLAFLTPFEGFLIGAIRRLAELFVQSWAISTMQALSIAALIDVATSGSAIAVLGMGCVILLLQSLYTVMAFKAMWSGISGIGGGGGAGTTLRQAMNPMRAAAGAAVGGAVGAGAMLAAPAVAGMAYHTARQTGASSRMATGYALSATRAGRGIGALATAMGMGDPEVTRGAAIGQLAQHRTGGVLNLAARQGLAETMSGEQRQQQSEQRQQRSEQRYQQSDQRYQQREQQQQQQRQETDAQRQQQQTERAAQDAQREQRYQEAEQRRQAEQAIRDAERQERQQQQATAAPIRGIHRGTIADAILSAATTTQGVPTVPDVTRRLGLADGAFGSRDGRAVQAVLKDVQGTTLPPPLTKQMMLDAGGTGRIQPATWNEAYTELVRGGLTPPEAETRLHAMEQHMQQLPGSVKVETALSAAQASVAAPSPTLAPPAPAQTQTLAVQTTSAPVPPIRRPDPHSGLVLPPSVAQRIPTPEQPFIVPHTARPRAPSHSTE